MVAQGLLFGLPQSHSPLAQRDKALSPGNLETDEYLLKDSPPPTVLTVEAQVPASGPLSSKNKFYRHHDQPI
jgi:hypothetical protein